MRTARAQVVIVGAILVTVGASSRSSGTEPNDVFGAGRSFVSANPGGVFRPDLGGHRTGSALSDSPRRGRSNPNVSFRLTGADVFGGADRLDAFQPESGSASPAARGSFLCSDRDVFGDASPLWDGFLTGMKVSHPSFSRRIDPIGNPLYFETPFINTQVKLLYLWHDFPSNGQIGGGQLNAWALQIRLALTERLALIATKDGWTELNAGILPRSSGTNDFALGFKYALIVDDVSDFVLTSGMRWELHNGARGVIQGGDSGDSELSPFITMYKGWDRWQFMANLNARIPFDNSDGNYILNWDLHFGGEVAPELLPGFNPLIELHALHYLTDGDALPVSFGGLDYSNIGASGVAGSSVFWGDLGFRWRLSPNVTFGAAYGFPISNPGNDIFNQRVTVDLIFSY